MLMDQTQHPAPAVPTWRLFNQKHTTSTTNPITITLPNSSPNQMSSTTATATATATLRQTYWCHECDMSVSLLFSSSSSVPLQVVCPHSHSHLLELMDSHSHYPCPPQPHFLDFNLDEDDDDDPPPPPTSLISSLTTIQISDSISQESCAICKDEFCGQSEVQQLPCKHLYHSQCILPWLSLHSSCPLCRFQLPGDIS